MWNRCEALGPFQGTDRPGPEVVLDVVHTLALLSLMPNQRVLEEWDLAELIRQAALTWQSASQKLQICDSIASLVSHNDVYTSVLSVSSPPHVDMRLCDCTTNRY